MILQSVYRVYSRDQDVVHFRDEDGQMVTILLSRWQEMGKPEQVSVTIMRLMTRTNT